MNKKLIKTIATITCGLGVASSISFMTTSCGSSNKPAPEPDPGPIPKYKALPDNIYKAQGNKFAGFKDEITDDDIQNYVNNGCNAIVIPTNIDGEAITGVQWGLQWGDKLGQFVSGINTLVIPQEIKVLDSYTFDNMSTIKTVIIYGSDTKCATGGLDGFSNCETIIFSGRTSPLDWQQKNFRLFGSDPSIKDKEKYIYSYDGIPAEYIYNYIITKSGFEGLPTDCNWTWGN